MIAIMVTMGPHLESIFTGGFCARYSDNSIAVKNCMYQFHQFYLLPIAEYLQNLTLSQTSPGFYMSAIEVY